MRKLFLALVVIASLTACTGKSNTEGAANTADSTVVKVDSVATSVDSTSVDTTATK